jgi:hypothetical protein
MTSHQIREDGTFLLLVHLTLKPGRDDAIIDLIKKTPDRRVAGSICEILRIGLIQANQARTNVCNGKD